MRNAPKYPIYPKYPRYIFTESAVCAHRNAPKEVVALAVLVILVRTCSMDVV